jgi:hypothetical protein
MTNPEIMDAHSLVQYFSLDLIPLRKKNPLKRRWLSFNLLQNKAHPSSD